MSIQKLDRVTGLPLIPAMTTDAERDCYYRLTREAIGNGAIIEFGSWLGASTAYIAAAIRDSGSDIRAHVYDKFQSKKGHVRKVKEFYSKEGIDSVPIGDAYDQFHENLGPLIKHIQIHRGEIENKKWDDTPIALIITDAPKRIPAISAVLTNFRGGIREGTVMAWQDFCHFPSYEIAASLYRLRDHFEFTEGIVPGTTMVFRVSSVWGKSEVSQSALSLDSWKPSEVKQAWNFWLPFIPKEKHSLFRCGEAMFLSDIGFHDEAAVCLGAVLAEEDADVFKKWTYLHSARPDFCIRYSGLFDFFNLYHVGALNC